MKLIFILILGALLQSCLVSRTQRPILSGYVYDRMSHEPIEGCKVGETFTDEKGYYQLEEIRYRKITFTLMESRPLFVGELVEKQGYISDTISRSHKDGGGMVRGVSWEMDTVFLKTK